MEKVEEFDVALLKSPRSKQTFLMPTILVLAAVVVLAVIFVPWTINSSEDKQYQADFGQGSTTSIQLVLKPLGAFPSQHGNHQQPSPSVDLEIQKGSLLTTNGEPYNGTVRASTTTEPYNVLSPTELRTLVKEQKDKGKKLFGVIHIKLEDGKGRPLVSMRSMKLLIDPEQVNITVGDDGNATAKLYWLDPETGRWREAGPIRLEHRQQSRRRRRSFRQFLEAEVPPGKDVCIVVIPYDPHHPPPFHYYYHGHGHGYEYPFIEFPQPEPEPTTSTREPEATTSNSEIKTSPVIKGSRSSSPTMRNPTPSLVVKAVTRVVFTSAPGMVMRSTAQIAPSTSLQAQASRSPTPPSNIAASWARWSPWQPCSRSCGRGQQQRVRKCVSQASSNTVNSKFCAGKYEQSRACAEWKCPSCNRTCAIGTLNAACDSCSCDDHVLIGRVLSNEGVPLANAGISLAEAPYRVLAQTNVSGNAIVPGVCAVKQSILITKEGFVPQVVTSKVQSPKRAAFTSKLQRAVPPSVTQHPESKVRFAGQNVTFCCKVKGNPPPEIEWFRNGDILDDDVYNYSTRLNIPDVNGMGGIYRCRAINDYGAEFSTAAQLSVHGDVNDTCNPTPSKKTIKLPLGCAVQGTKETQLEVGECLPVKCLRRGDDLDSSCGAKRTASCCGIKTTQIVTAVCGGRFKLPITKVTSCGCTQCTVPTRTRISGVLVGGPNERPVTYADVIIGKRIVTGTNSKGRFTLNVPASSRRVVVTFKDSFHDKFEETTKVFTVNPGQIVFFIVTMQESKPPIEFNSSKPFRIPLGNSPDKPSFAEIEVPENSLLTEDGTPYTGPARAHIAVTDARNISDILAAPGDFTSLDEEGEEEMLVSYGMMKLKFEDPSGKRLVSSKSMEMLIDPEQVNITVGDDGNGTAKLYWLDPETGRWIEAGPIRLEHRQQSRRRRRAIRRFFITKLTPPMQGVTLNLDKPQVQAAVRVKSLPSSVVRVIRKDGGAYTEKVANGAGDICLGIWRNTECYMQAEKDGKHLTPNRNFASFPTALNTGIVQGGSPSIIESFRYKSVTDDKGPVYEIRRRGKLPQSCTAATLPSGHRQFEFSASTRTGQFSSFNFKVTNNLRSPLSWLTPARHRCFIKVKLSGAGGANAVLVAESYREVISRGSYGYHAASGEQVGNTNVFVTCLEIRCPGDVWNAGSSRFIPEKTFVSLAVLSGNCVFSKLYQDIASKQRDCPKPPRSSPRQVWGCVPLITSDNNRIYIDQSRGDALRKCRRGSQILSGGVDLTGDGDTVEFRCNLKPAVGRNL